jgi:DNA-binding transcriptional ArsR family regulator
MNKIQESVAGHPCTRTQPAQEGASTQLDERIFLALSDPTRRQLLDDLYYRDGQRPGELSLKFDISRQAVLKHLTLLEEAGLIVAERSAQRTVYHLNRAPLRRIYSEWLAKFTRLNVGVDCG